jgi:lysophospholipase L1-like esterase
MKRLSIALLCLLLAPAAAQAKKPPVYYVSLGDSLGAGYQKTVDGTVDFRPGYTRAVYKAARNKTPRLKLRNFSCPGEDTATFAGTCPDAGHASTPSQLGKAARFMKTHKVKYVTISLGANDFTKCADGDSVDLTCVSNGLTQLKAELPKRFKAVRRAAGKKVKIAALELYNPYLALYFSPTAYSLATLSDALVKQVNTVIADVAGQQKFVLADGYGAFDAGNLTNTTTFNGQTVPVAVANVCADTQMCLDAPQKNIHPTDAGYALLGKAFITALGL